MRCETLQRGEISYKKLYSAARKAVEPVALSDKWSFFVVGSNCQNCLAMQGCGRKEGPPHVLETL
jgi:hypothetical protein